MREFKQLELGTIEEGKEQGVFIIPFLRGKNDIEGLLNKENRGEDLSFVIAQMRWDGYIGFPGGKVDGDETLIEAVVRESYEEINLKVDKERVKPLTTFSTEKMTLHTFSYELKDKEELIKLIQDSLKCDNFLVETQGCVALKIANFTKNRGVQQIIEHNWMATARIELETLIKEENLEN